MLEKWINAAANGQRLHSGPDIHQVFKHSWALSQGSREYHGLVTKLCELVYPESCAELLSATFTTFSYKDKTKSANWKAVESTTAETSNTNHFLSSTKNSAHFCEIHKLGKPIRALYTLLSYIFLKEVLT